MNSWTAEELHTLDRLQEIRIAGRRRDGSLRTLTIVWQVVVDGKLYVRSVRGAEGAWYKGVARHHEGAISWNSTTREVTYVPDHTADDRIDAAYFDKYGNGGPTRAITNSTAKATTLRVEPR
ncbi:hypothetical protein EV649_1810 [Kribbella sp. VKM Ac-2569]|uniref:DUF2255 family protein n=1 Tax=Kribbella sp. VKM Ac-2569 TaxID=2512220 RepID=UPI0010DB7428|nr:DUF2255 family protein [Kribbella sp. VKM Ac-2569]RZT28034.1 hypothetical protein EV649_1810 [Kribbella sp. VKM Ac-2569]